MKKNWKETIVVVLLIGLIFTMLSLSLDIKADNSTYIEMKSETSFNDQFHRGDTTNHTRLGFEKKTTFGKVYIEGGHMTDGHSFEAGYKFKWDKNLTIKGKFEGKNASQLKSKLETEIRYTW